jgi:hypothetical protein
VKLVCDEFSCIDRKKAWTLDRIHIRVGPKRSAVSRRL